MLFPSQLTFVDSMAEIFAPLLAGVPLWAPPPNVIKERGVAGIELRIDMDLLGGYRHTDLEAERERQRQREIGIEQ